MACLELDRVGFGYGREFALSGIDLEVPEGTFMTLIGPNGGGKTTLLNIISGLLPPHTGRVSLHNRPLAAYSRRELARTMAVISSSHYFAFPFPAIEIVAMGRYCHLDRFQKMGGGDWRMVEDAMKETQTWELRGRPISDLSSGERQRVLLARSLAQDPSILLLDEPNVHLDINHQIETFRLLRRLNRMRSITLVVVLHDLAAAAAFSDTVVLLSRGEIVKSGPPREVISQETIRSTYRADLRIRYESGASFPQISYDPD